MTSLHLPTHTTFGFELEFEQNADPLTTALYRSDLVPSDEAHSYHCDCHDCCANVECVLEDGPSHTPFYVQRDSSCSGEVISRPMSTTRHRRNAEAIDALCEAAVEVDAEPGYHAGLHVHVARNLLGTRASQFGKLSLVFAALELELMRLAAGRFPIQRTMNSRVRDDLRWVLEGHGYSTYDFTMWADAFREDAYENADFLVSLWNVHQDNDRHSNLNVRSRFRTVEFRLWNSTRSPWRVHLAVGLSVALANASVLDTIAGHLADGWQPTAALVCALDRHGFDHTVELAQRQWAYLANVGGTDAPFAA